MAIGKVFENNSWEEMSHSKSSTSVSITLGTGNTGSINFYKRGNIVNFSGTYGGNSLTPFSAGQVIGTLPSGWRPSNNKFFICAVRTGDAWGTGSYYPVVLYIEASSGEISLRGNGTNVTQSKQLVVSGAYFID